MQIYDLNDCPYSIRHGMYGGQAGNKDGILINGDPWIVKYPKSTKFMDTDGISYVTSSLSEYLGSHIYQILGISSHQTELGIRQNKLVVACRDFRKNDETLFEMKTIKNAANQELAERLETELHHSSTGDRVNLNELLLHLNHNPILTHMPNIKEQFWNTVVIDILIDNSDRNNGNWGILRNMRTGSARIAPVYDNGNAFSAKASDAQLERRLGADDLDAQLTGGRTAYEYNGKLLSAKKLLKLNNPDLQKAIRRLSPKIKSSMPKILDLIDSIPETYDEYEVCSPIRKEYYKKGILARNWMLEETIQKTKNLYEKKDYGALAEAKFGHIPHEKTDDFQKE